MPIVANASEATVIFLQSHPAWIAAQQRDHQLEEEMRRHPAFLGRQRAAERSAEVAVSTRDLTVCPGADTPA
ncbi:hypothetical protein HX92_1522 [Mycobacterium tuberculosis]|nr:hypothetical protein [Mycobacterium tuberculosis]AOZ43182.1 hypothetical protein BTB1458_2183 [Mycobacterium tuberculosis]KQL74875.1 hypothetical protein HX92_1522 [Mycobacterium tuberculosis]WRO42034.1 hypothetical protein MUW33_2081a [Mycobacterium canetti]